MPVCCDDSREMFETLPWPFPGNEFPLKLGAIIHRTVLSGERPALQIVHLPSGGWAIADGVSDPNGPGACIAAHIWHAIDQNSSLRAFAGLPPGHVADRAEVGEPWVVSTFEYEGDGHE